MSPTPAAPAPASARRTRVPARVRAPELVGRGGWVNTGGRPVRLADLRGKAVLLDFWTFCCVNCLHVLDELRELEREFGDVLVVVGVHSPKFAHETDHQAVVDAVERYEVHHPVLDDPDLTTWSAYAVRAWPTLTLVDPEGYVVAQLAGEGHLAALRRLLAELVADAEAKGTLRRGSGPYVPPPPAETALRFPAKVLPLPAGTVLVADTRNHGLVELPADGEGTPLRRIGSGRRGRADGRPDEATFAEPQGLCLLPGPVAAAVGYDVVVADTANHLLRGLVLRTGQVRTVAGTGRQWMQGAPSSGDDARGVDLSSPWDVAWYADSVVVAMAGVHQLWRFDPCTGAIDVLAGTTNEGLRDGTGPQAWLAQPSGLAVAGDTLWVADAETSALRRVRPAGDGEGYRVETAVGTGLFDFGHRDGPAPQALLQHPLGVAVLPDGAVAVADTYNGAVRRLDPVSDTVTTLATRLAEPADVAVVDGELLVVEAAGHRLTRVPLSGPGVAVDGLAARTARPVTAVAPGAVRLEVVFDPPAGQHLDERYGPATRLLVTATPPELLADGAGSGTGLTRELTLSATAGDGVLHVAARAAACDAEGDNPACHLAQQDWGVPVRVTEDGTRRLGLVLLGLDG